MGNSNSNLVAPLTTDQFVALQIARMVASVPSILGAAYIVQHVFRSPKRRQRTLTRVICGMSVMDLLFSLTTVFSSTIAPSDIRSSTPGSLAIGNWSTCEAFGFISQGSSISSVIYNGTLTLYYLLTIRHGWSEQKCRQRLEKWLLNSKLQVRK